MIPQNFMHLRSKMGLEMDEKIEFQFKAKQNQVKMKIYA